MDDDVLDWLLQGDPAVRWQVERDLAGRAPAEWAATRRLIGRQGWGRRLLDQQELNGGWGGGLYGPKWTSTHYTMLLLRRFGLDPTDPGGLAGARRLLDGADWIEGGVSYWSGRLLAERCVNGMVLFITSWFDLEDPRLDDIAQLLLRVQMLDGGWNCRDHQGARHASMHTTISVLEGLLAWSRRRGTSEADAAMAAGHEFLLVHRLFRSHRTGEVIAPAWTKPSFPPRWHYDTLRALDHLRDAEAAPDPRASEAIELLEAGAKHGRWPLGPRHPGREHFRLEEGRGGSRWNTLRARRVLRWWRMGSAKAG